MWYLKRDNSTEEVKATSHRGINEVILTGRSGGDAEPKLTSAGKPSPLSRSPLTGCSRVAEVKKRTCRVVSFIGYWNRTFFSPETSLELF
jgi:hypothetical protein